jgi:hypothetical protein
VFQLRQVKAQNIDAYDIGGFGKIAPNAKARAHGIAGGQGAANGVAGLAALLHLHGDADGLPFAQQITYHTALQHIQQRHALNRGALNRRYGREGVDFAHRVGDARDDAVILIVGKGDQKYTVVHKGQIAAGLVNFRLGVPTLGLLCNLYKGFVYVPYL